MTDRDAFTFSTNAAEVMRITADGRFYVKGNEVETDTEVRDALVAFAREFHQQRARDIENLVGACNTALAHLEGRRGVFSTREVSTVTAVLRTVLSARVDEDRGKPWTTPDLGANLN